MSTEEKQVEQPALSAETAEDVEQQANQLAKRRASRALLVVGALCLLLFIWYIAAERITPRTDNARIRGYVLPLASEVAGRVVEIPVINNQIVDAGEVVARIDDDRYQLALQQAEAALALAGQDVGAGTSSVVAAQAVLVEAASNLNRVKADTGRILKVAEKGYVSKTDADLARAELAKAQASVNRAEAELNRAKQQAGLSGDNNPKLQRALAQLKQAQLDLAHTAIRAPRRGLVSNIRYDVGVYANPGQPLMTFISTKDVWIDAFLRENNLGHIQPGNSVDIALDSAPGRVFKGKVQSVSYGVQFDQSSAVGGLQAAAKTTGWLRDPQRFPVTIVFDDEVPNGLRREGGQADVIVYTEQGGLMYWLGKLWIHIVSVLSYVY